MAECRIEMLGGLQVRHGDRVVSQFLTQKVARLLACLALRRGRPQAREVLIDLLWPEPPEPEAGKRSLRVALTSLRKQLEPPGMPYGAILLADNRFVQIRAETTQTDVADFERLLEEAARSAHDAQKVHWLEAALQLYQGELLPGMYDGWAIAEQQRLASRYSEALRQTAALLERAGRPAAALSYAQRAVASDPYTPSTLATLLRLCATLQQPALAAEIYREWEQRYQEAFGGLPPPAVRRLGEPFARFASSVTATPATVPAFRPPALEEREAAAASLRSPRTSPQADPRQVPFGARLPVPLTRLFGREDDTQRLASLLFPPDAAEARAAKGLLENGKETASVRLVTLTGPAGTGKTRLAIQVAKRLAEVSCTVYFVALADLTEPSELAPHLARALDVRQEAGQPLLDTVAVFLASRPALLVLDNFEQLLQSRRTEESGREAAAVVQTLLERAVSLSCLITSRQRLGLAGEQEFPVAPLALPDGDALPVRLLRFPSVQLYVDRAQAARPDFQLTAHNAAVVASLCARLDGLPLALELAAAWVRTLPPHAMLQRLTDVLALPHNPHKGVTSRHRSLRAALDWSYGLLSPDLRAVFVQLSVFAGGWDVASAQAVCRVDDLEETLLSLAALADRSLLVVEERDELPRYRFLEAVREYADGQWQDAEARRQTQGRHRDFFLEAAEAAVAHLQGPEQAAWLRRLEGEHNNFRAALRFSFATPGEGEAGLRLAVALWRFWEPRGHFAEGREWLETGLRQAQQAEPVLRANALGMAGGLAYRGGDWPAAAALMTQGLDLYRQQGDFPSATHLLNSLGIMAYERGDYAAARAYHEESVALFRRQGDRQGEANALNSLGVVSWALGDLSIAQTRYEESLAINHALDSPRNIADVLNNMGTLARDQGDYARARALLEESLARARTLDVPLVVASVLCNLADLALTQGDCAVAAAGFVEGLHRLREIGSERAAIVCLEGLGQTAAAQGQAERAARLFGAGEGLREKMGAVLTPNEADCYAPALASARAALSAQAFAASWGQGRAMTLAQAAAYAEQDLSG